MNIRHNGKSAAAHRSLSITEVNTRRASQRLSSGFRINSAADDAAGQAISDKLRAQLRGLDQAHRNAQDGISLIQTAEGGIATINAMIIRMRELVVQAANDTSAHDNNNFAQSDRAQIQREIDALIREIDAVSVRLQFNTRTLLSGNYARQVAMGAGLAAAFSEPLYIPPAPMVDYTVNIAGGPASGTGWSFDGTTLTVNNGANIAVTGTIFGAQRIVVNGTANMTLQDVTMTATGANSPIQLNGGANLTLALTGSNTITAGTVGVTGHAGIQVGAGTSLTIAGGGSLTVNGSGTNGGAGIGGGFMQSAGNITIQSGTVVANGGGMAAGIGGGGLDGNGGNITILGGYVTATGGLAGAGIGGGLGGNGGSINIQGGTVTALGGQYGAGIGGGLDGHGGNILLTGGTIYARSAYVGAGVGGGAGAHGGNIHITGNANLTATGGNGRLLEFNDGGGAGIGGGGDAPGETRPAAPGADSGTIIIEGDNVTILATGGSPLGTGGYGWGIGGGGGAGGQPPGYRPPVSVTDVPGVTTVHGDPVVWISQQPTPTSFTFDYDEPINETVSIAAHNSHGVRTYQWTHNGTAMTSETNASLDIPDGLSTGVHEFRARIYVDGQFFALSDAVMVGIDAQIPDPGPGNGNGNGNDPGNGNGNGTLPPIEDVSGPLWLQLGANASQGMFVYIEALTAYSLGLASIAGSPHINVLQESGINISPLLAILDEALHFAINERATLGAKQNRLEFTAANLQVSSENMAQSISRILDADMAKEMMRLTQSNVLQQAAVSMLSQAQLIPERVLTLLQ